MGQDIHTNYYSEEDTQKFKAKLKQETELLKEWFENGHFTAGDAKTGIELEAWLVDKNMLPSPSAVEFIEKLGNPQIVPEISRFNFEINSSPYELETKALSRLKGELTQIWNNCREVGKGMDVHPLLMGTLATLRPQMLDLEFMSPQNRYSVMNNQIMKLRNGKPMRIHLEGKDQVILDIDSVLTECAATSLQIHISVDPDKAKRYYNASVIASPLMVAISANSPYFFGKELWDESRIAVFKQSVEMDCFKGKRGNFIQRVTLGEDYINESLFELFEENLLKYPVLLPEISDDAPELMGHLRLHNGTIWRWNRPIIGLGEKPHLRIEHRTPSAGPTIDDSVANTAFFIGLVEYLANQETPPEYLIDFEDVRTNFYKASKQSLYGRILWLDGKEHDIQDLLLNKLYPEVKNALLKKGLDKDDIRYYMDEIIYPRLEKGINGARWQKAFIHMRGKRFQELLETYIENQKDGRPVHTWDL